MRIIDLIKKKGAAVIAMMLCGFTLMGACGCDGPEPVTGGVDDRTDPNAPKVIESKEIVSFSADVCLIGEWSPGRENYRYEFAAKPDGSGALVASEAETGISVPADGELLAALQEIVEKYGLASQNGVYRVTAGLPPEYQACTVTVNYASRERIAFTVNNDPYAEWAKDVYLLFADWFAAKGDDTLLPPVNDAPVERVRLCVSGNGAYTEYSVASYDDPDSEGGETLLLDKYVYDKSDPDAAVQGQVPVPDDYGEKVTAILAKYDLRPFDVYSVLYGRGRAAEDAPSGDAEYYLHVDYQDGRWLEVSTDKADDVALLRPVFDDLVAYLDPLFSDAGE